MRKKIGLFAETLVRQKDFYDVSRRPGVAEAFEARGLIDIVITSMGDASDKHDLLSMFLAQSKHYEMGTGQEGEGEKWIGNVQYRPYTASGAVKEGPEKFRAVTLFELSELARIAEQKKRHVILIARECGLCEPRRTRAEALKPLLENPELKVFSSLVMDAATAEALLA